MPFYRKKPVVVEAYCYLSRAWALSCEFDSWMGDSFGGFDGDELIIVTLEDGSKGQAKHVATPRDYIIKGVNGEFYACKPDIFEKTYERVD